MTDPPAKISFLYEVLLLRRLGLDLHLSAASSVLYTFLWFYNPLFFLILLYLAERAFCSTFGL